MNEKEELNKLLIDIENAKHDTESCFSDSEAREKAIKKMNQRHLDMALILQSIALKTMHIHHSNSEQRYLGRTKSARLKTKK